MRVIVCLLLSLLFATNALSREMVSENPAEPRVRELAALLRCPVCQSENILDSQSPIAREMMVLLREQVSAGARDDDIVQFFRQRYGDYVLLRPATDGVGLGLWLLPIGLSLVFIVFACSLILALHRKRTAAGEMLSKDRLEEMKI